MQNINGGTLMLIQLNEETAKEIKSFADMLNVAKTELERVSFLTRTVVLGPMSPKDEKTTLEENLQKLMQCSVMLSNQDFAVLDLHSFQPTVEKLICKLNINGYPYIILDEFTLPLIKSDCIDVVHFTVNYADSMGAKIEHNTALEHDRPIRYIQ